jgi:hypothetical protein
MAHLDNGATTDQKYSHRATMRLILTQGSLPVIYLQQYLGLVVVRDKKYFGESDSRSN